MRAALQGTAPAQPPGTRAPLAEVSEQDFITHWLRFCLYHDTAGRELVRGLAS